MTMMARTIPFFTSDVKCINALFIIKAYQNMHSFVHNANTNVNIKVDVNIVGTLFDLDINY